MKKILSLLIILSVGSILAQAPQKMSYQAILRNTADGLITNMAVGIKVSILKGSITGNVVYEETQYVTTNINGLVSIEIGTGTVVSGSFPAINWGNDSYFIKTETDPTGGSNYTITGTSQLLSVPYALYAEHTKPAGKSTIYLRGDITDAEAVALLAKQLGPDTEQVYITDTTALTTVNLDTATTLVKLTVTNNPVLTTLTGNAIETFYELVDINDNPSLTTLAFNGLINANIINLGSNYALQAVTFSNLEKLTTSLSIYNVSCNAINLPQLTKGYVSITSCPNLTALSFPNYANGTLYVNSCSNLTTISMPNHSTGNLQITSNPDLTSIALPNYSSGSQLEIAANQSLLSIQLPSLNVLNGTINIYNNLNLLIIDFPNLQYTPSGRLYISNNSALTNITTPNLLNSLIDYSGNTALSSVNLNSFHTGGITITNSNIQSLNFPSLVNGGLILENNTQLTTISMPNLTSILAPINRFKNNHLSSASINSILHQLTLIPSLTNKYFYFQNQTPLAPPTGQGIIDKATLISAGNTVITD